MLTVRLIKKDNLQSAQFSAMVDYLVDALPEPGGATI